jgi:RNA polymerase sigma-70 factor (ECF subfamily)
VYASPENTTAFLQGDVRAYEATYKELYKPLFIYALGILNSQASAEEIVQNVFMKLWEKKETLKIETSLKAYLYKAVHNHSLNAIKHNKVVQQYETHLSHTMTHKETDSAERDASHKQLQGRLRQALSELPEQCRTVFQMSRFEDLKYKEIAERLSISPKTVENHMGKALKLLRGKLADYLVSLLAFLIYMSNNF